MRRDGPGGTVELLAMEKVAGSSPIIRSSQKPRYGGFLSVSARIGARSVLWLRMAASACKDHELGTVAAVLPLLARHLVLHLAFLDALHGRGVGGGERPHVGETYPLHHGPRARVGRHRLGDDPVEPDVVEAVADQLTRPLRGEALAPVTRQQPVAQVGYAGVVGLVGSLGGLKDPPADELVVDETDPEAESIHLLRGRHPPRVAGYDLLACAGPTAEVAHHLEVRVELDLPLEVLVGERHQRDPLCLQRLLGHGLAPRY